MAAKWVKSIPYLWPKRLKNHTLWARAYLYSPDKGASPGEKGGLAQRLGVRNTVELHETIYTKVMGEEGTPI